MLYWPNADIIWKYILSTFTNLTSRTKHWCIKYSKDLMLHFRCSTWAVIHWLSMNFNFCIFVPEMSPDMTDKTIMKGDHPVHHHWQMILIMTSTILIGMSLMSCLGLSIHIFDIRTSQNNVAISKYMFLCSAFECAHHRLFWFLLVVFLYYSW